MKALTIFTIGAMAASSSLMAGSSITNTNGMAFTNNLVRVTVTEMCTSTNSSGGLTNELFGNHHLIGDCAADMGITNLTGLSLVYNRSNSSLDVVSGTNQSFVCTALSFEGGAGGVSITNTNNTTIKGLAFVFVGTNTTSSGTIFTKETIRYGSTNQITSWSLFGQFQYALPASGTNGAVICRGVLRAGVPIIKHRDRDHDDDEDNEDEDDDNGGNKGGNHHGHNKNHRGDND